MQEVLDALISEKQELSEKIDRLNAELNRNAEHIDLSFDLLVQQRSVMYAYIDILTIRIKHLQKRYYEFRK